MHTKFVILTTFSAEFLEGLSKTVTRPNFSKLWSVKGWNGTEDG